ncbi:MAG TPA: hypothetical protein VFG12_03750 [Rhodopila sp.]|jgi:hypothetical protein|nr:hypothetical protein [Rhodopila sp.]
MTSRLGLLALAVAGAAGLVLLSRDMRAVLLVWVVASFPIGVLAGHCVLNDHGTGGSRWRPPD